MKTTNLYTDNFLKHPNALKIWNEIIYSYNTFPNDSSISRFFLPEELIIEARSVAAAFTILLYNPQPDIKKIYNTKLYYMFLLSSVCGIQIFLKQRALETGFKPYKANLNKGKIENAKANALFLLTLGTSIPKAPHQVMKKFIFQLLSSKNTLQFRVKGSRFDKTRYQTLLNASILWGYFFAKNMLKES